MTQYEINELKNAVYLEAKEREFSAGMNGEHGDRGASRLREQLKFYEMGANLEYPKEWEKYKRHIDPEYKDYERLKRKFEGDA